MPVPQRLAPTDRSSVVVDDGLHLFTQHWLPDAVPGTPDVVRGVVTLVHGYGEHSSRYGHVARALAAHGFAVYTYDQRGHGRSDGPRAYVDRFETYLADLDRVRTHVARRLPSDVDRVGTPVETAASPQDLPHVLLGHSMGGLVVLLYALARRPSVRGLILSGAAIEVNPDLAPILRRFSQWIGRLVPTLPTVSSVEGAISRDPDVVAEAEADPLNYHGRVKARMGAELLRAGDDAKRRLDALTLPLLVLHGTGDTITDPTWSRRLHARAASDDKTIRLYDGLYHEIFNEPEREAVLDDVTAWLVERCGG